MVLEMVVIVCILLMIILTMLAGFSFIESYIQNEPLQMALFLILGYFCWWAGAIIFYKVKCLVLILLG